MDPTLIIALLPSIVKGIVAIVDKVKGSGSGADKKPLAVDLVTPIFSAIQKTTPGLGLPQDAGEIAKIVQDNVDALNAAGALKGHSTLVAPAVDGPLLILCASLLESKASQLRQLSVQG